MSRTDASRRFDPYGILHALADARVEFVLIGALARVLHGSDETTAGVDLTPSPRPDNLERLASALRHLGARERRPGEDAVRTFASPAGRILVVPEPAGTRGYRDLRRRARPLHLGEGLRPQVADPGDLVRMIEALARPEDARALEAVRRVVELDRGVGLEP
jgi:hypothetical protein